MKLHIQLFEARSLRPPDRSCHPFVVLKLGSVKCRSSTSHSSTPDPGWFEDFVFSVDDLRTELHLSVWHHDRFKDHFLGKLRLPISVVLSADQQTISPSWFPLQKRSKMSKAPVTGELRVGFSLSGKASSSRSNAAYPSDLSNSSSVTSTPERSYLSRVSSSESIPSAGAETSPFLNFVKQGATSNTDGSSHSPSLIHRISTLVTNKVSSSLNKSNTKEAEATDSVAADTSSVEDSDSGGEEDPSVTSLVPPSFFEDDGINTPSSTEDLPAPFEGGILLDNTYALSAKALNGILFRSQSEFLKELADLQRTTDLVEGPWTTGDGGLPRRVVTYIKAASKLVKAVKATEDQVYLRADDKGFVITVSASTPDVPYGSYFRVDLQYCIFTTSELDTGECASILRVSWKLHLLTHTMMKGVIENGTRQGLQDSYKQFAEVLEKYAKPYAGSPATSLHTEQQSEVSLDNATLKTDWQLVKEYFCDLRVCVTIACLLVMLLHIYLAQPCPKSGLEFFKLDLPDTLHEFITAALLGVQLERILRKARKFLSARLYRGSDHGVKAKGSGWLLSITLVEAQNLPASNEVGVPDPYVVFTCSGKARTSSVKLQTSDPNWEERFEFDATDGAPSTMKVEVFDFEGPFTEAESLGHVEINFLKRKQEELADLWVPLEGKNALISGARIHLRIVLYNTKEANSAEYIAKVEKEVGRKISKRSLVKNTSFQRLFSLPSEEFLVNDFSCSLKRKFLLQGRLFLSPRVLAFYSNIFGHKTKFTILWEDIEDIKEATLASGSVGMLLNPGILVFTKRGRAADSHHGAKSIDSKGRCKFQFQSFIHFKPAYRTMMALWKNQTLTPEKQMEIIDDIERRDNDIAEPRNQTDDSETFLGIDEANLTEVYSAYIPLSVESMVLIYDKENLDEKIAEKSGRLNYSTTPWEPMGDDSVQQRRVTFKLSNQISLFGTNVTCIQQMTKSEDGQAFYIDEVLTLPDVPFGDNFQIRVREELENASSSPPSSVCRVFVGVAWHKSTMFQSRISKNIFERYTKHLRDIIDVSVKEILEHKDDSIG